MKGSVFVEFLDHLEQQLGFESADAIVTASGVSSGGAYTAVGTYPFAEMQALVGAAHAHTGVPVSTLLRDFGYVLFGRLAASHSHLIRDRMGPLDLLAHIQHHIHVEVRKLYPDAELPHFDQRRGASTLELIYRSPRGLADLCEGLIRGCFDHFGTAYELVREDLSADGTHARFALAVSDG